MMVGGFDDGCLPGVGSGALWPVEGAICLLLLSAPLESLGAVLYSVNGCRRIRQSAADAREPRSLLFCLSSESRGGI